MAKVKCSGSAGCGNKFEYNDENVFCPYCGNLYTDLQNIKPTKNAFVKIKTKKLISGDELYLLKYANTNPLKIVIEINSSLSIDLCCFSLDSKRKLSDDKYLIYYNQNKSPDNAIIMTEDKKEYIFDIYPSKLSEKIKHLVFTASINDIGFMSYVKSISMTIFDDSKKTISFKLISSNFKTEQSIIIAEILCNSNWKLCAIGKGINKFDGGMGKLLQYFT